MKWRDFIPVEFLKVLVKHFIGSFLALSTFGITGRLANAHLTGWGLEAAHFLENASIVITLTFLLAVISFELFHILKEVVYGKADNHRIFLVA